jgi:hypothetical protein
MKEFGLRLKRVYIKLIWEQAVKQWFGHNSEPLFKLARQLNKINYELRQIRRSKKTL